MMVDLDGFQGSDVNDSERIPPVELNFLSFAPGGKQYGSETRSTAV